MPTLHESRQTARKDYTCDECRRPILKGQRYWKAFGSAEDTPDWKNAYTIRICRHCDPTLRAELGLTPPTPEHQGATA